MNAHRMWIALEYLVLAAAVVVVVAAVLSPNTISIVGAVVYVAGLVDAYHRHKAKRVTP